MRVGKNWKGEGGEKEGERGEIGNEREGRGRDGEGRERLLQEKGRSHPETNT